MPGRLRAPGTGGRAWLRAWPLLLVGGFALAGALGGVVWQLLWTPPTGVALGGEFVLDGTGTRDAFDGTALFVVVAATIGVVGGLLVGWLTSRDELAVLGVSVLAAALGTAVMYAVGHALSPPDPALAAADAEDYTALRDQLTLAGRSPWLMMVGGLLVGLVVTLLGVGARHRGSTAAPGDQSDAGETRDPGEPGAGLGAGADTAGERPVGDPPTDPRLDWRGPGR